ncbi:MAG: hypothetical protein DRQ78_09055 [Epsilonproteobacteria bacterium]|nr:MAG: hypothetical protein DRQ78_09055 [Campylobacterota bacterium]
MNPQERLEIAAVALKDYENQRNLDAIEDFSAADIAKIGADFEVKPHNFPRLIGIMIYIRKRLTENKSRIAAFKDSFPERCVAVNDPHRPGVYAGGMKGEPISDSAIAIKSKRLENSQLYIKAYQLLQSNLYISFAVQRFEVIQEALEKSLDPHVSDRDKAPYMKIFLDETRKPEGVKGPEFNLNITNNDVSVITIEEKLTGIAAQMKDMTAGDLVEIMHQGKQDESE